MKTKILSVISVSYMAGTTGLEPATFCVTGRRSNQTELRPQTFTVLYYQKNIFLASADETTSDSIATHTKMPRGTGTHLGHSYLYFTKVFQSRQYPLDAIMWSVKRFSEHFASLLFHQFSNRLPISERIFGQSINIQVLK